MSAEFDAHAPGYDGGMDNPVKAILGRDADQFLQLKLDWLLRRMPGLATADASFRVLDYGCGTAALLRLMGRQGLRPAFAGCDISAGMLEEAARTWPAEAGPKPELALQDGARTPFPDGGFDLVVISAVLHHVSVEDRRPSLRISGACCVRAAAWSCSSTTRSTRSRATSWRARRSTLMPSYCGRRRPRPAPCRRLRPNRHRVFDVRPAPLAVCPETRSPPRGCHSERNTPLRRNADIRIPDLLLDSIFQFRAVKERDAHNHL